MLLHHMLSITGLTICFLLKMYGTELVTTIMGAEITNPLLQLRWFLKESNRYDSTLGDIVDVAFMVTFGVFRILLGTILLVSCYLQETTDWLTTLGGTCIYSVGWVFWISIVQYGLKKYRRKYGSKKNKAAMNGTGNDADEAASTEAKLNGSDGASNGVHRNGVVKSEINGNCHKRAVGNGSVNGHHVNGVVETDL